MPSARRSETRRKAVKAGFRSGMEQMVAGLLKELNVPFDYEPFNIEYEGPKRRYKPDFVLHGGVIIEVKGRFTGVDRAKHLLIKKQHPELDIRFVFQIDQRLTKRSSTKYSEWCDKHGFKYAFNTVPREWITEEVK